MLDHGKSIIVESLSGIILGIIAVTNSITFALIIFRDNLSDHLLMGVSTALISTITLRLIIAIRGSSPIVIAGVQEIYIVISALFVADINNNILQYFPNTNPFPTIMTALILLTMIFGIWLYIMGKFKLGYFIRFIPYPVFSAFLAATGWLLLVGGGSILGGRQLNFGNELFLSIPPSTWIVISSLVYAYIMMVVSEKYKNPLIFFLFVLIAFIGFYFFLLVNGISLQKAQEMNLMFQPKQSSLIENIFIFTINQDFLSQIKWILILNHSGQYLAFLVIASISLLLNLGGFELVQAHKFNLEKDLKTTGVANIITSLLGGFAGYIALGGSALNFEFKSKTKLPALISSVICLIFLISNDMFIRYLPFFIFAIVAFYLGIKFLYKWIFSSWNQLSNIEHAIQLVIFISAIYFNLLVGLIIGTILTLFLFVFRYSLLKTIKDDISCEILRSNVERSENEEEILKDQGKKSYTFILQGYLYFGNFEFIIQRVEEIIGKNRGLQYLIIDLKNISGIDISAIYGIIKILQIAEKESIKIIFTNSTRNFQIQLNEIIISLDDCGHEYYVFPDLDHGLEWLEDTMLKQAIANKKIDDKSDELAGIMHTIMNSSNLITKCIINTDDIIYQMNEPADCFYYVESGAVDVVLRAGSNNEIRLRSMRSGTIIGETGMYLDVNRTAIVRANQPCVLLRISKEGLKDLEKTNSALANELHKQIIKILCKRLTYANHFAPRLR